MLFYNKLFYSIMAAAEPKHLSFIVTKVTKIPETVDMIHPTYPIASIEMPEAGNSSEKRYLEESFEKTLDSIRRNIVTTGPEGRAVVFKKDYEIPFKDTYYIYHTHPNIGHFQTMFDAAKDAVLPRAGSRRRRPSRKYKKSKRVLRRKSRSTRRR